MPPRSLTPLAMFAASLWLRYQPAERAGRLQDADHVRHLVHAGQFSRVLDFFTRSQPVGRMHLLFLERAFPYMAPDERAASLLQVWIPLPSGVLPNRALRLFLQAPLLRRTVPRTWPRYVAVYRAGSGRTFSTARWHIARGIAWATDRAVAVRVASADPGPAARPRDVRLLGCATVARDQILAYRQPHASPEGECILAPSSTKRAEYERLANGFSRDP